MKGLIMTKKKNTAIMSDIVTVTIDTLANNYIPFCDLDYGFQSRARWSFNVNGKAWIKSQLLGKSGGGIILVDVTSCKKYCEHIKDMSSFKYFDSYEQRGIRYIVVDGNNRYMNTLIKFMKDEIAIPDEIYPIVVAGNRRYTEVIKGDNDVYTKMDEELRWSFRSSSVTMTLVKEATRLDLSEMFLSVNSGVTHNPAERRNCIYTPTADIIRSIADKYDYIFRNFQSETPIKVDRRESDELVAMMMFFVIRTNTSYKVNKNTLMSMYTKNDKDYNDKVMNIGKIIDKHFRMFGDMMDGLLKKGAIVDFFYHCYDMIYSKNKTMKDKNAMIERFINAHMELMSDRESRYDVTDNKSYSYSGLYSSMSYFNMRIELQRDKMESK